MPPEFLADGFARFPATEAMGDWVTHAERATDEALNAAEHQAQYQCEGTWFVGLDVLPNDAVGRVLGSEPLSGDALAFAETFVGGPLPLHQGQVSVTFPGYPKPRAGETDAAFGYRLKRDAAHVDGVLGEGQPKRRYVREPHAYILGIGLSDGDETSAPLVIWRGSHNVMRRAFGEVFQSVDPDAMADLDVTEAYVAARKACFDTCERVLLPLKRGESVVLHPMALHGVAPWRQGAGHRSVAYFRPEMPGGVAGWLQVGAPEP